MKLINLTGHEVNICDNNGIVVRTIPSNGHKAICSYSTVKIGYADGIPLTRTAFGAVSGLPDQQTDTIYIVSVHVKQASPGRMDVVSPGRTTKDSNGRVIGCHNFNI